jgi:hypothetical protein
MTLSAGAILAATNKSLARSNKTPQVAQDPPRQIRDETVGGRWRRAHQLPAHSQSRAF